MTATYCSARQYNYILTLTKNLGWWLLIDDNRIKVLSPAEASEIIEDIKRYSHLDWTMRQYGERTKMYLERDKLQSKIMDKIGHLKGSQVDLADKKAEENKDDARTI